MEEEVNPRDAATWHSQLTKESLMPSDTMTTTDVPFRSASKLLKGQFLLFRILWTAESSPEALLSRFIPQNLIKKAQKSLGKAKAWKTYLDHIPKYGEIRSFPQQDNGLFTLVRWQQLALVSAKFDAIAETSSLTPTKTVLRKLPEEHREEAARGYSMRKRRHVRYDSSPGSQAPDSDEGSNYSEGRETSSSGDQDGEEIEPSRSQIQNEDEDNTTAADEQIVNMSLIMLLDALTIISEDNTLEITAERKRFRYEDLWTALTDGYLRPIGDAESVCAIIEVKAAKRALRNISIQRQEAGEVVAWISKDSQNAGEFPMLDGNGYWRLLIAQDQDQIWLVTAQYGDRYKDYIKTGESMASTETDTFMTMTEHGPFSVTNLKHMQTVAVFFQAFCSLQAERSRVETTNPLESDRKIARMTEGVNNMMLKERAGKTPSPDSSKGSQPSSEGSPVEMAERRRQGRK